MSPFTVVVRHADVAVHGVDRATGVVVPGIKPPADVLICKTMSSGVRRQEDDAVATGREDVAIQGGLPPSRLAAGRRHCSRREAATGEPRLHD